MTAEGPTLANPSAMADLRASGLFGACHCASSHCRSALSHRAFRGFLADDGWAIASHIALSTLMALFPFLIVVTALAGFFFGSKQLADEAAKLLLEAWPQQVAAPIASDITRVLTGARGDVLTFGVLFAVYFASSGVESLRVGLNRAYTAPERRSWWLLRLESIFYVLVGAAAILAFAFLVVLEPLIWQNLVRFVPALAPLRRHRDAGALWHRRLRPDHGALISCTSGCRPAAARSSRSRRASSSRCCCGW